MTENQPERPHSTTPPNAAPPSRRRKAGMLMLAGLFVLLLMSLCAVGGYVVGNNNSSDQRHQTDRANHHVTTIQNGLTQLRTRRDMTISTLDATNHHLQEKNRVLVIRVSKQTAVVPHL